MKEFCAKDLIIADLGTFQQPACVGPRQAPTVASWMDVSGEPSHLRGSLPFSGYSHKSGVHWGWESRGQTRTAGKPGRVCLEASVIRREADTSSLLRVTWGLSPFAFNS